MSYFTLLQAREKTGAEATVIYVPPQGAAKAIIEAIDAEVLIQPHLMKNKNAIIDLEY